MNARTFKSRTSREALAKINRELGPEATIVSRDKFTDSRGQVWVEITAMNSNSSRHLQRRNIVLWGGSLAATIVAIAVIIFLWLRLTGVPHVTGIGRSADIHVMEPSVAVLAFEDMSPEKDMAWFCQGVAEEIIHKLTFVENIHVPSRSSAFKFDSRELDIKEIASKLNVNTVLEGSVRLSGKNLRITANLINASDGNLIWSKVFNSSIDDVFRVQEEIGLAVVAALKVELSSEEHNLIVKRHTSDPVVDSLYKRAWYFSFQIYRESLERGIQYFKQAIEIAPDFAPAYAGLAWSYAVMREEHRHEYTPAEAQTHEREARAAVKRALELDSNLAEGRWALGAMKLAYELDLDGAIKEYQLALAITPGNAKLNSDYSYIMHCAGHPAESIRYAQKGVELDPLSLASVHMLAKAYLMAGDFDSALTELEKADQLDPDNEITTEIRLLCLIGNGNIESAEKLYEETRVGKSVAEKAFWLALLGRRDESLEFMKQLSSRKDERSLSPAKMAYTYIFLGENDLAFQWIDRMVAERNTKLFGLIKNERYMESILSDPRWNDLKKKVGIEQ